MKPVSRQSIDEVLRRLDIADIGRTTIRQCVNVSHELEKLSGEKFVHLEFGIPGLNACQIGIDAQKRRWIPERLRYILPPAESLS